ncbi:nitrous oxide reductase accessory protein NosL [Cytobacillus spongiae]|uniref:nitrous oxide reductase accessory protein NosL n=1 Tax=Cytobacillus spongiae TaxID=2901381 RepID=UPI001F3103BF|nr:nitrous oxide reductase accessory protein NosL [Cytobacillus spongiae]UII56165.1 nitrous oxide reductase accessory protein NosL [Cytobacillus spongiae]
MKKMLLMGMVLLLMLPACGKEQTYEPVEVNQDIDVCEICNMSLANQNFVTEIISKDGDVYKFDDIGCMVEFIEKEERITEEEIAKQYVRDMETGSWIELEQAYHVYHPDFWTPMANGVVTFESEERARQYLETEGKGELYNYEKLKQHQWSWEQ